jgi:indolepyruvate ferredoxin oxidoreductase alpha subunit
MGIRVDAGKNRTGLQGELFARKIASRFAAPNQLGALGGDEPMETQGIPARPPVLCPGCPHRALFTVLGKMKLAVAADIGCYTLGALPPLNAVDSVVCMGASIGMALGLEKARGRNFGRRTVAVIGDSTFVHSGITGLIDVVYNQGHSTVIIADNSTTGMTGHQPNPTTGFNIHLQPTPQLDLEKLCAAVGIQNVRVVDPYDMKGLEALLREELEREAPSVVITRRPCVLLGKEKAAPLQVDKNLCIECGACMRVGCPALSKTDAGARIDESLCKGCFLCAGTCPRGAIKSSKA